MPRLRDISELRWYLYRSSSKLDELYNQLVSTSGPFSGNVEVSIPGFKASLGTSAEKSPSDVERLSLIENELRLRNLVGNIDAPYDYFAGEMSMRWGLFDDHGHRPVDEAPLVFFGGLAKDEGIIVGLGGSSKHVVGYEGATSTQSRSMTATLVPWLLAGLSDQTPTSIWDPSTERQLIASAVASALHYLRPPTLRLRFLAKTLLTGSLHDHQHLVGLERAQVVLGTPLYVAMVDPPEDDNRFGLDDQWS